MEPSTSFELSSEHNLFDTSSTVASDTSIYVKIIVGLFLVLVILVSILGNLLVCVAIASDRRLRRLGNLFIVSLAIADLCVGALVMTFALANDLLDYWPFGPQLCEIWIAFDISCSTCSIINLCAIALDRFAHIKDPMRYNRWMTKRIVICCVSVIWLVSCLISFLPISLGWHRPDPSPNSDYFPPDIDLDVMSKLDSNNLLALQSLLAKVQPKPWTENDSTIHTSVLTNGQQYALMFAKSSQIESVTPESKDISVTTSSELDNDGRRYYLLSDYQLVNTSSLRIENNSFHSDSQLPTSSFPFEHISDGSLPQCALDLTPTYAVVSSIISFYLPCIVMLYLYAKLYAICQQHVKCIKSMTKSFVPNSYQHQLAPSSVRSSLQMDGQLTGTVGNQSKIPLQSVPTTTAIKGSTSSPVVSTFNSSTVHQQSHVTEHKAAITLGIIMGTFLACWMPFFCINIVAAFCKTCIPLMVFKILTWLGYFNSCLNPIIYSIFNTEFRDAFRRILVRYLFNADLSSSACGVFVPCSKTNSISTGTVSTPPGTVKRNCVYSPNKELGVGTCPATPVPQQTRKNRSGPVTESNGNSVRQTIHFSTATDAKTPAINHNSLHIQRQCSVDNRDCKPTTLATETNEYSQVQTIQNSVHLGKIENGASQQSTCLLESDHRNTSDIPSEHCSMLSNHFECATVFKASHEHSVKIPITLYANNASNYTKRNNKLSTDELTELSKHCTEETEQSLTQSGTIAVDKPNSQSTSLQSCGIQKLHSQSFDSTGVIGGQWNETDMATNGHHGQGRMAKFGSIDICPLSCAIKSNESRRQCVAQHMAENHYGGQSCSKHISKTVSDIL